MKFGVEFDVDGHANIKNLPENLKRYKLLYQEIIHSLVDKELYSNKYRSLGYSVFSDPVFIKELEKKLDEITEFLLDAKVFPEDILDPRENKIVDLEVVYSKPGFSYFGLIHLPCYKLNVVPGYQEIFEATKRLKVIPWTLVDNYPTDYYIFIARAKKKQLTEKVICDIFNRYSYQMILRDFEDSVLKLQTKELLKLGQGFSDNTINTGIKIKLNTGILNEYSPLRYIIETRY